MLLRNFKSTADEISKRNLADELLQVEINNASILDERISKYQDKNTAPPVPPQFKSQSDILKDTIKLERDAIDGVMEIGFSYGDASKIVSSLGGDRLVELVQGLPFIKSDIQKKFNPKLLSVSFFNGYLQNYFDELGVSFGFSFDKAGGMDIASLSEIKQILTQPPAFEGLRELVSSVPMSGDIVSSIIIPIENYLDVALSPEEETKLNTGGMTAKTRQALFKRIKGVITKANIPAPVEVREMSATMQRAINEGSTEIAFNQIGVNIANRLSGMTKVNLKPFESIRNDIHTEVPSPDMPPQEVDLEIGEDIEQLPFNLPLPSQAELQDYLHNIQDILKDAENEVDAKKIIYSAVSNVAKYYPAVREGLGAGTPLNLETLRSEITKKFIRSNQPPAHPIGDVIEDFLNLMRETIINQNATATRTAQRYLPQAHRYYEKKVGTDSEGRPVNIGFGMGKTTKAIKKHFKEDEKFLKKVSKKVVEAIDSDSSSDEETMSALKKHAKAEKPYEAKIEKAVGAGYIHKRIPIKKIVGKGIEVEEQPTYRTFGKYVMHIPHLTDKNVLNLKYPSLGSIPSIKPMTISEDYKDFVIDVMNTGRVNDKAFTQLQPHEQKHFERITKGAGLLDTFKLKRSGDDDEKAEVDRFNLLRGNYLGGNNAPDVIKELKGLVVKFINDGRIARHEGLNLLMELSI